MNDNLTLKDKIEEIADSILPDTDRHKIHELASEICKLLNEMGFPTVELSGKLELEVE